MTLLAVLLYQAVVLQLLQLARPGGLGVAVLALQVGWPHGLVAQQVLQRGAAARGQVYPREGALLLGGGNGAYGRARGGLLGREALGLLERLGLGRPLPGRLVLLGGGPLRGALLG